MIAPHEQLIHTWSPSGRSPGHHSDGAPGRRRRERGGGSSAHRMTAWRGEP